MKLLWLTSSLVVLGSVLLVKAATEEESNHLQDVQQAKQIIPPVNPAATGAAALGNANQALQDFLANPIGTAMLQIGNILGLIDQNTLNAITGIGGLAAGGTAAAAAVGTSTIGVASGIKTAVLNLILKPLDVINGILAIVGLVFLIIYLVEGGDVYGLLPTGFLRRDSDDGYDTYTNYVRSARALWDAPIVQRLTAAVQEAIVKYD